MRTIKFRAWDKKRNQFVPQGEIVFSFYGDTRIEVVPNELSYSHDLIHDHPDPGRFIVEQFTGLTDRNGVEIYEGDFIQRYNYVYEVFYEPLGARFHYKVVGRYKSGRKGVILPEDGKGQLYSFSPDPVLVTYVIGNIHENPDLIETQSK